MERSHKRPFNAIRPFQVEWDPMGFALSSLILNTGNTSVMCSVSIEESVPSWRAGKGLGWLSAEYRLLPASTPLRKERELVKLSGRTQEIQRLIGRSLRSVIDMSLLGERTLLVDCDVIQADAGTRTTSITGSWMAIYKACSRLIKNGTLKENPVHEQLAAISVGLVEGNLLLDLDYKEDSKADVDLNVVMDTKGYLLDLQGTAERAPFDRHKLNELLDCAWSGIQCLQDYQKKNLDIKE